MTEIKSDINTEPFPGKPEESYPLSPLQHGMLFHNLIEHSSGVDIEQIVCTFTEELDVDLLCLAWQQVTARHSIMRTAFAWEGLPEPVQSVYQNVEIPIERRNLRSLTPDEQENTLNEYLLTDRSRGFDLTRPPLIRIALFETGPANHRLVWTFHHALLDGTSYRLVLREVFATYEALLKGMEPEPVPRRVYKDYIEWSNAQDLSKAETFWRGKLGDFERPTPLVVERDAKTDRDSTPGRGQYEIRLAAQTTVSLRDLANSDEFTLNSVVQGAWALLLSIYSAEEDVVFGATRACRHSTLEGIESMLGLFINTLPMRVNVVRDKTVADLLRAIRRQHVALRDFENTPLVKIQEWSGTGPGAVLFESIIVFDNSELNASMQSLGDKWENREFKAIEQTNFPLTLFAYGESELLLRLVYDESRFDGASIKRMAGHMEQLLTSIAENPAQPVSELCLLTDAERKQILDDWNDTAADYDKSACIHDLFEARAARNPDAIALAFEDRELTYSEVNQKADRLARKLIDLGVGPDRLVGVCIRRSPEMVISLLAVLKSGGAYVPLDPDYPAERLEFMISDSNMSVLLTERELGKRFADSGVQIVDIHDPETSEEKARSQGSTGVGPENLAYVIYTSGSTGVPKGVMVEHRNVVNFFKAIDDRIGTEPGVWLAVTSISFDISVMELLWTLTRGFKVVIQGGTSVDTYSAGEPVNENPMDFSLFYFASDYGEKRGDKYRLLMEGARFADNNGFTAVWTPERHFHSFGGLYPNPAVTSAAVAAITENVRIRAGSVVLPLHDPVRVAEEWAVVDNISKGRVDIAFASGWHASDFAIRPESYPERYDVMRSGVETVRKLWRGESVTRTSGDKSEVEISTYPRPVQDDIPIWFTAAGNPDSFRGAGEAGANLLTNLLGQSVEELAEKIRVYREARQKSSSGSGPGKVTLMLHTFVGEDLDDVKEKVRKPFTEYLRTSVNLIKNAPLAFPAFRQGSPETAKNLEETLGKESLDESDLDILAEYAFERYFETSGLFGTPETCLDFVNKLKEIGVDEIACLVDFNVDADSVLAGLEHLNKLRELSNTSPGDYSIPAQIAKHKISHMQCTPSAARLMASDPGTLASFKSLEHIALGGEALPESLVREISAVTDATIHNMYGPTETTIWSTALTLSESETTVSIGKPLANTQVYILNKDLQPVPVGVPGELYIGGDGVTRGYLDQPQLTAERFIPNPFGNGAGRRIYKTGDLAAFGPDGTIEFRGRLDNQVKVRGYRVELGEIQTVLDKHPYVRQSIVHARDDSSEGKSLVAYVVGEKPADENTVATQVEGWKSVWDETYRQRENSSESGDFAGWNSSYDGAPIPEQEMNEWLEGTVSKILDLEPSKVLEIGCGTGLILFQVAPKCSQYDATDISANALEHVRRRIDSLETDAPQVNLFERAADDFTGLPENHYDTVVLNSVVQYFPDLDYFVKVLKGAFKVVKPGGSIFIGDVRSLPLLEAFHLSIEMHRAADSDSCSLLREKVKESVSREEELNFAPEFFERLYETFSEVSNVEITLKKGNHLNELTKFRYDVKLTIANGSRDTLLPEWKVWDAQPVNYEEIRELLAKPGDETVAIAGIPNQRLQTEIGALNLLKDTDSSEKVSDLKKSAVQEVIEGLDPALIRDIGRELGVSTSIRWSPVGPDRFDVIFFRREDDRTKRIRYFSADYEQKSVPSYTNQRGSGSSAELARTLRNYLQEKLPPYMVPSSFVSLEEIPLTPNGKIDLNALPAPEYAAMSDTGADEMPAGDIEEVVADLWAEMLGIDRVGTNQSFFHVGGHSLLATQLVSRLRSVFHVDLSLREVFEYPTVSGIADCLVKLETQPGQTEKIAQIMKEVKQMPEPETGRSHAHDG